MVPFSLTTLFHILPILILSGAAVLLMLIIAFFRSHKMAFIFTFLTMTAALIAAYSSDGSVQSVTDLLRISSLIQHYWILILFSGLVCTGISYPYLRSTTRFREEWYLLLLVATAGGLVLAASYHFSMLFIGLELMSIPLYGLAAFALKHKPSLEAGLKYLVLSAVASAFLLFGMALIYASTGSLSFSGAASSSLMLLGGGLILAGLGFKLSWVPFHIWTPDVYQGAPMPVTAFLATASKVAVMIAWIKLFAIFPVFHEQKMTLLLTWIAGASILLGNVLAVQQVSLKRLLAYSSIAHFGYVFIGLLAYNHAAIWIYLATYVVASLTAFAVLSSLTRMGDDQVGDHWVALRGLAHRHPLLAVALAVSLLSMAGIPLTAGFIGKFFVLAAGVNSAQWALLTMVVIGSAIGLYYYLRVVSILFQVGERQESAAPSISWLNYFWVLGLAAMTLILGVWPSLFV